MKDNLKMILNMDMGFYILLMVVNLKVNLLKEKHMELEVLWGNMGRLLMGFGKIINQLSSTDINFNTNINICFVIYLIFLEFSIN